MDISPKEFRFQTICLFILSAFAICFGMYFLKPVLIPFVLALFFTFSLTPIIDFLMRTLKFPRMLAIITAIILGFLLLSLFFILISASIGQMTSYATDYQSTIRQLLSDTAERLPLERLGIEKEQVTQRFLETVPNTVGTIMKGLVSSFLSVLSSGFLVVIFMIFLLLGKQPPQHKKGSILDSIESRIKRYISAMLFTSTLTGVLVGVTLFVLGVKFAFVFGVLTILLNFIPNIGSIVATMLPIPVALLDPEMSTLVKILVFAIPCVIQLSIGNILQPKIMGESLELHPIVILMSLIFFGMMWGIVGMFLASPIAAVVKIVLEKIEYTQAIAQLMSGDLNSLSSNQ
ncbi:MAG: AI-2E family transporter [Candidatus Omnitrophica bacterium]|nr:AI-2E family transporter [Candidatus Omnitrophota bacterium]